MATVLDADNRLNAAYVDSAASLVFAAPEDRPVLTHGSCVIDGDSTGLVSAMDGLWLSTVSMHAWRFTPCNFPQSVYSLRCDVLLATGVDVGALGMAEDAITSIRAHFRKNADSIQLAGASFYASPCPDVATRLTQMKRHQYGVTIASHALVAWLARPSPRHLVCLMQATEPLLIAAVTLLDLFEGFAGIDPGWLQRTLQLCSTVAMLAFFCRSFLTNEVRQTRSIPPARARRRLLFFALALPLVLLTYGLLTAYVLVELLIGGPSVMAYVPSPKLVDDALQVSSQSPTTSTTAPTNHERPKKND